MNGDQSLILYIHSQQNYAISHRVFTFEISQRWPSQSHSLIPRGPISRKGDPKSVSSFLWSILSDTTKKTKGTETVRDYCIQQLSYQFCCQLYLENMI